MVNSLLDGRDFTAHPGYPPIGLLIDGAWIYKTEERIAVESPSDESTLGCVPVASPFHLDQALAAASRGFGVWRTTAPVERAAVMRRAASLLRERCPSIAGRITLELGKTLTEARAEVTRAADILEWDAGEALRLYGRINPSPPGWRQMVLREAIGPVAAFTPWNAPINSPARKISAAIAAGCSIVAKGAEETPAGICALAQALMDAGLPPGVLNLVFGRPAEISMHLIASPIIRLVTFTGSIAVGKHLTQLAALHMKPALMELGGHAAVIVCKDVDPVAVARLAAVAKFRMAGQICVSPTRFLVHSSIHDAFLDAFASEARRITVGSGADESSQMGALANSKRLLEISSLVDDAVRRGARLVAGGRRIGTRGFFFEPTILAELPPDAKALAVEPFGPLATVTRFDDLAQAVDIANQLSVGLAAYAFTGSLEVADRLADTLECGLLSINHFGAAAPDMPFGGIKDSGFGREGGAESLGSYTVTKMVSMRTSLPTA